MVIAYHLVWTGYGWWLPNDPRGSTSRTVANERLRHLGDLHFGRRPRQPSGKTVRQFYDRAELELQHPLLRFDDEQVRMIGDAFSTAIRENVYTCYACVVMPDHVHLLIRKHRHKSEEMIHHLQRGSRLRLSGSETVDINHPIWTESGWKGFLNSPNDIRRTIRYIENNPIKEGRAVQTWPFVTEYDGWPFHKKTNLE